MSRLFLRVFLWFWLGSTCLVIVFAASLILAQPDLVTTWRIIGRSAMRSLGAEIANGYEQQGPAGAQAVVETASREGRFRVWLHTAGARQIAGTTPLASAEDIVASALAGEEVERAYSEGMMLLARQVRSRSGTPYVVIWEAPRQWAAQLSPARFLFRLLALLVTGGVVCWLLTWQITKPVQTLRATARRVAEGDLSARVGDAPELARGDELSELAQEFDRMAARIEELLGAQERLFVDISHELRSPLARMSLALDLARRRLGDDGPEHRRIGREIQRLDALIGRLLELARLRRGGAAPTFERVDLRALVHDVVQDARFEAGVSQRHVVIDGDADAFVRGHGAFLRSALDNVIRNAIRYAPAGTSVAVTITPDAAAAEVVVTVRDHGPGVPPETLPQLFDPFFRVDTARDRDSGGTGLGLAIAREAVAAHGGGIHAANHPGGGLLVTIALPLSDTTT